MAVPFDDLFCQKLEFAGHFRLGFGQSAAEREVRVDIEPFVASTTPRQHPVVTTDSSGAWHAPADLEDRYAVTVGVTGKTLSFKRHLLCGGARAQQSVGDPNPPNVTP